MDENEQTTDGQTAPTVETTPAEKGPTTADGGDLAKVRELVLKAHPDVVPDLIAGSSVDELIASVAPARTAYQRIADRVLTKGGEGGSPRSSEAEGGVVVQPPTVPAGGATNVADPGDLGPTTKIAQALAARKRT